MTTGLHEVHFLTLTVVRGRRGWIAPVELPRGTQQSGAHVVPVKPSGSLFTQYRVEFVQCAGSGANPSSASVMELQPSGVLSTSINGWNLRFQLRRVDGQPVVFEYVGALTHPDFALPLAEIIAEDEDQLTDLYARERIVIVGCDPVTQYGGLAESAG